MPTEEYFHIELEGGRVTGESNAFEAWLTTLIDASPWPLVGSVFGLHSPDVGAALATLQRAGWKGRAVPAGDALPGYAAALLLHHIGVSKDVRSKFSHVAEQVQRARSGHVRGASYAMSDGSVKFRGSRAMATGLTTGTPAVLLGLLLPAVQKVRDAAARKHFGTYNIQDAWPK